MTDKSQSADDPVMAEALDWVIRVNENPNELKVQRELDEWVTVSEANAEAYRKALRVWKLTGDVPPAYLERWNAGAPSRPSERVEFRRPEPLQRRRAPWSPEMRRVCGSRKWWFGLGGGASAAVLAALLLLDTGSLGRADYRTRTSEVRDITLPDGSVVTLAGGSAIQVNYDAAQRRVALLYGEAFFKVTHDTARPFTVEAADMTVRDIGTAFDVDLEPSNLEIAVQSGIVGVTFGDTAAATLTAGDCLTFNRAMKQGVQTQESPDAIASWRSGRLVVDNAAVGEVVQQMRRYYHGYIWFRDPELSNRRISGVYDLRDPISALKAVVEPHAGVVTAITPYLLVISSR